MGIIASNVDVGAAVGKAVAEMLFMSAAQDWSVFRLNVNVDDVGDDDDDELETTVRVAMEMSDSVEA